MLWTAWWELLPDLFFLADFPPPPHPSPLGNDHPALGVEARALQVWLTHQSCPASLSYTAEFLFMFQMHEMNDNVFENGSLYTQHLKCLGRGNSDFFLTLLMYSKKVFYVRLNKAARQKHLKPNFPFLSNAPHDSNGCRNLFCCQWRSCVLNHSATFAWILWGWSTKAIGFFHEKQLLKCFATSKYKFS